MRSAVSMPRVLYAPVIRGSVMDAFPKLEVMLPHAAALQIYRRGS